MANQAHIAPVPRRGTGWVTFAAVMFVAAAAANTLYGISALVNDDYFQADELLFGDLTLWGLLSLGAAAIQLTTGVLLFRRSSIGIFMGLVVAMLHGTIALLSIGAYPLWTMVVLVIDGLIIYGLTVHGPDQDW